MYCVLPIGSYEQHGPYLPPTVDAEVAIYVAERLAERLGARVLAPIYYTCSKEHQDFAPTIYVECETFMSYVKEVLRSAARWCDGVIVVAGHGGIADAGNAVASQLDYELGPKILWLNIWSLAPVRDHAGSDEASIYLAVGGRLVDTPKERICEGDVHMMRYLRTAWMSRSGVVGCIDPAEISAERGSELLETIVDKAYQRANVFLSSIRAVYRA
ncbi:MAG: creatininase family protein [Thermoproteus sp.]|jgi:creatinine amidohydrolase|nr:creatininase family protein [Thermoproteus sp.]